MANPYRLRPERARHNLAFRLRELYQVVEPGAPGRLCPPGTRQPAAVRVGGRLRAGGRGELDQGSLGDANTR